MIQNLDADEKLTIPENSPEVMQIDPKRERFPLCVVWTSLPIISWFIPFIGHIGICREDGVILDFAGPNFVCVDNFAFGSVTRYLKIDKKLCGAVTTTKNHGNIDQQNGSRYEGEILTWDDALGKSTQEFQHRSYNILTCNCHSFVANNLNRLGFRGGRWNVVTVAALLVFKGRWVDTKSMVKACLPFLIVFSLGLALGGYSFLQFWALFLLLIVGWFVLGTCLFRGYIQL